MNTHVCTASAAAFSLLLAGAAAAEEVSFLELLTTKDATPARNATEAELTSGGVTLTLANADAANRFVVGAGGTGIVSAGEEGAAGNPKFQINPGEDFTLSFDTAGTLQTLVLGHFPGASTITVANGDREATAEVSGEAGFTEGIEAEIGLTFEPGDVLTFTSTSSPVGAAGLTFRLQDVLIETAAEPD